MSTDDLAKIRTNYEIIGGADTIKVAVDRLYVLILDDPELAPYFAATDLPKLKAHMAGVLSKVLGGPDNYGGRSLAEAHEGLEITQAHYDKVCDYLDVVLTNLGAPVNVTEAVQLILAMTRHDIVTAQESN